MAASPSPKKCKSDSEESSCESLEPAYPNLAYKKVMLGFGLNEKFVGGLKRINSDPFAGVNPDSPLWLLKMLLSLDVVWEQGKPKSVRFWLEEPADLIIKYLSLADVTALMRTCSHFYNLFYSLMRGCNVTLTRHVMDVLASKWDVEVKQKPEMKQQLSEKYEEMAALCGPYFLDEEQTKPNPKVFAKESLKLWKVRNSFLFLSSSFIIISSFRFGGVWFTMHIWLSTPRHRFINITSFTL